MEYSLLNHVQGILERYFAFLGQCNYEKAKETVEKERDHKLTIKGGTSAVLSSFLTTCSQLAVNEKNYMASNFLAPKGFLRKDNNLKAVYETMKNEFWRLKERGHIVEGVPSIPSSYSSSASNATSPSTPGAVSTGSASSGSVLSFTLQSSPPQSQSASIPVASSFKHQSNGFDFLDNFCSHICEQLYWFASARIEMIEIYEQISACTTQKFLLFDKIAFSLNEIVKKNFKLFHHPLLSPIKTAFTCEAEALLNLLQAQSDIQNWRFLSSLFNIQEAHTKLASWLCSFVNRESSRRNSYGYVQRASPLYQWLCKIKAHLLSKFSLYFYVALSRQTTSQEIKIQSSRQSVDFYQKLTNFQRKNDGSCIVLIFDTHNGDDYCGHGYRSSYSTLEPLKGLNTFPSILVFPPEKQLPQLPSIIMIMTNRTKELSTTDNIIYFYDVQIPLTFYLVRPDPRITMVFMFEGRKVEKDVYITSFIQEMYTSLKGNKVFAAIKPVKF